MDALPSPLSILHVGKFYPPDPGGIEVFTAALCRAQAARGHAVTALVHGAPRHPEPADRTVDVRRVPVAARALFTPLSPRFRGALRRALSERRPDVVHAHLPNPSALWLLTLAAARGIPLVLHWHADIVSSRIRRALRLAYAPYRPLETRLLARASRVIATSPPYLAASRPLTPFRARCRVIPLGVDPGTLASRTPAATWPGDGQRVLAIGRLTYYKGFEHLIAAVAGDPAASLVIVGRGEEERTLRHAIEASGARERIRLVTDADDAARNAWLASADVLCQPSVERTEAFGLVLLEAFAHEKPVVVSELPGSGAPWVVRESGAGLLFPPADVPGLARRLAQVRTEPELAARLAANGRAALRRRFDIRAVAAAIDALYAEVLEAVPPGSPQ